MMVKPYNRLPIRQKAFFTLLLLASVALALLAVTAPLLARTLTPPPTVGQVASQDYRAPATRTFPSQVLTEQKRETMARTVSAVYTLPDTNVARKNMENLRAALAYITSVRGDIFASQQQKLQDLAALEDLQLNQETANIILGLTETRWQAVQQESLVVLEKIMGTVIRPDNVQDARNRVPALVSLSLPETHANIVAEMVSAFVNHNTEYSEALTEAARENARQNVQPVNRTFVAGQTIVQQGQVLSAEDIEALEQFGLIVPQQKWQDIASASALVILLTVFFIFYLRRSKNRFTNRSRSMALIALLFLSFDLSARLIIPNHTVFPYAFPLAAYALTIRALFGTQLALISSLPLAILVAHGLPNAMELTIYYIVTSLFGVLAMGRAQRMISFIWAGLAVILSGSTVFLIYRLPMPTTDIIGLVTLLGAAGLNGLASASLTVLLQFFLAQFMRTTTPMQLMDLSRPDHPLLQRLLRDAPGTYQHSLQVANLAEQASERIGADPLLTRVGALYHDIGKTLNPVFFIENQVPGLLNPHTTLTPLQSSQIIIRHVTDGIDLARQYRLPTRIIDFIAEHHGTMITRYQYVNAVKAAGGDESQVDIEQFRYPGPRPHSNETAILLLADGSEARVRAEKPQNEDDLRALIKKTIDDRLAAGQLDLTSLTINDLSVILDSFTATLRGIYHPRVKYPDLDQPTLPTPQKPEETELNAEAGTEVLASIPPFPKRLP